MPDIREQLRNNMVALISLVIALSALGYNTWRNERTERNRNIRSAGFELLTEIGSLQQIIFYAHFAEGDQRGDPRMGWADMLTINDLAALMPAAVAQDARELRTVWEADSAELAEDDEAYRRIDVAIDALRQKTLESLRALN
ncbi:MAG: hypothetical protein WBO00_06880 [Steroidobacteraceae bacterium]